MLQNPRILLDSRFRGNDIFAIAEVRDPYIPWTSAYTNERPKSRCFLKGDGLKRS